MELSNCAVEWRDSSGEHLYSYHFTSLPRKGEHITIHGEEYLVTRVSYNERGFPTLKVRTKRKNRGA